MAWPTNKELCLTDLYNDVHGHLNIFTNICKKSKKLYYLNNVPSRVILAKYVLVDFPTI